MILDKNKFFRQATLRICGNLDFEIAMEECLIYLRAFMPADLFHLTIFDRGLGAFRTIATATPADAKRVNIVIALDEKAKKAVDNHELKPAFIIHPDGANPLTRPVVAGTGIWKEHSVMVMHLAVRGSKLGNLILYGKGKNRFTKTHFFHPHEKSEFIFRLFNGI